MAIIKYNHIILLHWKRWDKKHCPCTDILTGLSAAEAEDIAAIFKNHRKLAGMEIRNGE